MRGGSSGGKTGAIDLRILRLNAKMTATIFFGFIVLNQGHLTHT